jgi:regulator of sigma E protease
LSFIFVLGVLVFVHELGHFLVAKKCGMRVEEFSLGYPPKAFGIKYGETEYLLSWLPLGGYVKIAGMSDFGKDDAQGHPWELLSKPKWMQASVMAAGPAMNIVLAFVLILTIFVTYGDYAYLYSTELGGVDPGSALYEAGVRQGDRILKINDKEVEIWEDVAAGFSSSTGTGTSVVLERRGEVLSFSAVLDPDPAKLGVHAALEPRVGQVVAGRPAESSGLDAGDLITMVDGQSVATWWQMSQIIQARADQVVEIRWLRENDGNAEMGSTVTPAGVEVNGKVVGQIGISLSHVQKRVPVGLSTSLRKSVQQVSVYATLIFDFLKRLLSGQGSSGDLAGPVAIAKIAGQQARLGLEPLLSFMAVLSINLAVLNLLPIPMLDGGHLFVMGFEAVTRRELSVRKKEVLQQIGFVFLLALMIYVTANDIGRLLGLTN